MFSLLRKKILNSAMIIFFVLLSVQLFNMQIIEGYFYSKRASENSVRKKLISGARGIYLDRNQKVLISNKPSFSVSIIQDEYDRKNDGIIERVLGVDSNYISKVLTANKRRGRFVPIKIKRDVNFKFISWLDENHSKLKGVHYSADLERSYSFGIKGSHIFGYVNAITPKLLKDNPEIYMIGDNVGATGIEKSYEYLLRGSQGYKLFIVDSKQRLIGKYLNGSQDKESVKGNDLVLSIDFLTQQYIESALVGKRGAIVALDPTSGEIICLASSPDYNLDIFASVTPFDVLQGLNDDPDKPLFNRATMSIYAPGSTIKMAEAIMAQELGLINPKRKINCQGGLYYGDRFFGCDHVHGKVNLLEAIERSCNTYFYELMLKTDLDIWAKYLSMFGFGSRVGIDIPEESGGILPNKKYYDRILGKGRWTSGNTISLGIGQGELSTTPLQLAKYTALLANSGKTISPHIVRGYIDQSNNFHALKYDEVNLTIDQKYFDLVREGMRLVVNGAKGTAPNIRLRDLEIAGKTGTTQNPHGKNHSIFIGFAPFDNPKIAVAAVIENSGYGSTVAAPIVQKVIKTYLRYKDKVIVNIDSTETVVVH